MTQEEADFLACCTKRWPYSVSVLRNAPIKYVDDRIDVDWLLRELGPAGSSCNVRDGKLIDMKDPSNLTQRWDVLLIDNTYIFLFADPVNATEFKLLFG